ncbi:MAG: Fur family transcriptional regulator [Myxococcota bacterium]|jgi:Fur family peroxide stress response transcriptional regulator
MARSETERQIAVELAARGLRATQQRLGVLRLLRSARDHPTAATLHRALAKRQPSVSLKTVYEALASLVGAGLAACVTDGGEPYRYEANSAPHYHARCRVCGRLSDLSGGADGAIRSRANLPEGFSVERISVVIVGLCARCSDSV